MAELKRVDRYSKRKIPFDWTEWLTKQNTTITTSTFTLQDGLTEESSSFTAYQTVITVSWPANTPLSKKVKVVNAIVCADGQEQQKTVYIKAKDD